MIVSPSGGSLPVQLNQLVAAAQQRWPGVVSQAPDSDDTAPPSFEVRPEGEPFFHVFVLGRSDRWPLTGPWSRRLRSRR